VVHFFSKFKNKLRTIPTSGEEQDSLKFSIKEQIIAVNTLT